MGILAAIAVPRLGGFRSSAGASADQATAATIGNAVSLHYANVGKPSESTTIVVNGGAAVTGGGTTADKTAILDMLKDSAGNLPKPQVTAEKFGFAAVVDTDGNVIVYYASSAIAADTTKRLWPKTN